MSLAKKLSTALNETRLLILGAQVLFGFQFHGIFQDGFGDIPRISRYFDCISLLCMVTAIGLLIAPSAQHRIVERGEETRRIHRVTSLFADFALLPFGVSLAIDVGIGMERIAGSKAALLAGGAFCLLAGLLWYAFGFVVKLRRGDPIMQDEEKPAPLSTKIDQMLTEARVILPGAQALLGFQLTVTLSHTFQQLPSDTKSVHAVALCCVALAVVLLMTPAALHRIGYRGEESKSFLSMGSAFVMAAPLPLAAGIAADMFVAVERAAESSSLGIAAGVAAICILLFLWYLQPLIIRGKLQQRPKAA